MAYEYGASTRLCNRVLAQWSTPSRAKRNTLFMVMVKKHIFVNSVPLSFACKNTFQNYYSKTTKNYFNLIPTFCLFRKTNSSLAKTTSSKVPGLKPPGGTSSRVSLQSQYAKHVKTKITSIVVNLYSHQSIVINIYSYVCS